MDLIAGAQLGSDTVRLMMACLSIHFPDQANDIRRLRSADTVFAQICADFESLAALLPCDASDPRNSDLIDSLRGLEDEIKTYLSSHSTPPEG